MANPYFNAEYYLLTNQDVYNAGFTLANAEQHYLQYGASEGRKPAPWFDATYYVTQNPDLLALEANQLFAHFTTYGMGEGRAPSAEAQITDANLLAYAKGNADLATAFGVDAGATELTAAQKSGLTKHFYEYGYKEDRPASPFQADTTPGQTFTLTEAVQNLTGTAGDDLFIAGVTGGGAGGATLTAGDKIDGAGGTDTIELFGNANAGAFFGAQIKSVEVVKAQLANVGGVALDVSANADVQQAWLINGTTGANTVNLTKAQVAGLQGTVGTTATLSFTNSSAAAGDVASLTLDGAVATAGVTINNIETLNVNASGANRIGTLTDAALTTLNVQGTGSVSATVSSAVLSTVDASAASGNQVLNLAASAAVNQNIKTGSGNDVITTTYAGLASADNIDLGAGNDSLRFTDNATFNTTATKARLSNVKNVEQLGVVGATAALTVDGDFVSQNSFYAEGTTARVALTNVADGASLGFGVTDIAANATGINTVGMKLGASTVNVTLTGTSNGASVVGGAVATLGDGLTVTGSSSINVTSTGVVGQPNNILDLTAADNQSIIVSGAQNLTLTTAAATGTTGFKIDGSGFTGGLTVAGTIAADSITGGAGNDRITGDSGTTTAADVLTGGAGADTFVYNGTAANLFTGSLAVAGSYDKITDFVAGTDKIALVNTGTAVTSVSLTTVNVATADDVAGLLTAIGTQVAASAGAAASAGLINVAAGALAGTYVLVNDAAAAAAATDTLIDVTGITGTLTTADFVFA